MTRLAPLLFAPLAAVAFAVQPPTPGASAWPFDVITHRNGARFQGLILEERPDGSIRFQGVSRPRGRPTVTLTSVFKKDEIARIKRLNGTDRAFLREKLSELDPSGKGERARMDTLELVRTDWLGTPERAWRYESDYFSLVSEAPEEVTRRAAVRLEQIYAAFARVLPPTVPDGRPTGVKLTFSLIEYKALLAPLGVKDLLNPAVYDPRSNQIVCGSDLGKLGAERQSTKLHHSQQLAGLLRYEERVRKLYKPPELDRYLKVVHDERARVWEAEKANGARFDTETARLFAILYHEAFHAYAATFVYPPLPPEQVRAGKGTGELPRWLNEGLAQVFETAVVEAGELRADHADRNRLTRARAWLQGKNGAGGLVPLAELLVAGREAFAAHHADQRAAADRAYLSSWALAHYLTFERRVIGTAAFRAYLVALNTGGDPRAAFRTLVDQDLAAFEQSWHDYVRRLQPDGSLAPARKRQ